MEYVTCNLCGNAKSSTLFTIKERLLGEEEFNIVQCDKCGLIYTNPRPTKEETIHYYPENYEPYKFTVPKPLFRGGTGLLGKTKDIIKRKLLNVHYGYFEKLSNSQIIDNILKILTIPLIYHFSLIFPEWKENGKALDIGCSTGEYLYWLKELGWKTYGVEFNEKAANWAREKAGLEVFTGTLSEADFPSGYFDVVTLLSTLEHLADPLSILKEIGRILKKDGTLIIEVPHLLLLEGRLFNNNWAQFEVPRHLYHFVPQTIEEMLLKADFKTILIRHSPHINFLTSTIQNILLKAFHDKSSKIHFLFNPEKNKILQYALIPLNYVFWAIKRTGRMIIYARKDYNENRD